MARHQRNKDLTPAAAMRAALHGLHRELRVAAPDKAGDLARKLAALAKDLAAAEEPEPDVWEVAQRDYDAEVERLIADRVHERVNAILETHGLQLLPEGLRYRQDPGWLDGYAPE